VTKGPKQKPAGHSPSVQRKKQCGKPEGDGGGGKQWAGADSQRSGACWNMFKEGGGGNWTAGAMTYIVKSSGP